MRITQLPLALSLLSLLATLPTTAAASSSSSSSATAKKATPLPLVLWHGLGDNYDAAGIKDVAALANATNPGTHVHVVSLATDPSSDRTASFFGNLSTQLDDVCAALQADPLVAGAPAVNALGFSQGGQFLRGLAERCGRVRFSSLVTFGSQHAGVQKFQKCADLDFLCKGAMALLRANVWSEFVQGRLVPAQYYRTLDGATGRPVDEYIEHSNFLADVNNERERKNATYKENLARLDAFVMYVFEDDEVVIPKETGWFGEVRNLTDAVVTPMENTTLYREDWIGLKALNEKGGLYLRTTPGGHMQILEEVLEGVFKDFFAAPDKEEEDAAGGDEYDGGELRK